MAEGWQRLPEVSPATADVVLPLLSDPTPLVAALARLPHTLVHGDWKAANLGSHQDGRTVLLDFGEAPGEASPLADVSWYLALNAALLPESKDDTLEWYRTALERHGCAPWSGGTTRPPSSCSAACCSSDGRRLSGDPGTSSRGGRPRQRRGARCLERAPTR